jgi:hypothetical protein
MAVPCSWGLTRVPFQTCLNSRELPSKVVTAVHPGDVLTLGGAVKLAVQRVEARVCVSSDLSPQDLSTVTRQCESMCIQVDSSWLPGRTIAVVSSEEAVVSPCLVRGLVAQVPIVTPLGVTVSFQNCNTLLGGGGGGAALSLPIL